MDDVDVLALARAGRLSRSDADEALSTLVTGAVGGDPAATETLVSLVYELSFVRGAIGRVLFDRQDAEDALQETMLNLTRSLSTFDQSRSFIAWACRIAHNKAVDVIRRQRSSSIDLTKRDDLFEAERFSSTLARRVDLHQVLAHLPPKLEEVVRLRDLEHHSYQEIADLTGAKLNTVRSRLARGRAQAQLLIEAQN